MNRILWIACFILVPGLALRPPLGAESPFCVPQKGARRSLEKFEGILRECGRRPDCWERARAVAAAALEDHPGDPHLHRAYQDLFTRWRPSGEDAGRELEPWYRRLVEQEPENPVYLYARGRFAADPSAARELFLRAVAADADFPWAHVGLAYVAAARGAEGDRAELAEHLGRFIELCPSRSKVALSYADNVDGPEFWRRYLPLLREALGREPIAGTYVHYAQIWRLELAATSADEHGRVHERIAADLGRILPLGLWESAEWTAVVLAGYELLGDDGAAARFQEQVLKRASRGAAERPRRRDE